MSTSGTGFQVDPARLLSSANNVKTLVPQIQAQLNKLNGEMETMFAQWKGGSAGSFQRLHATWHQDYMKLNQSLNQIGDNLATNHHNYHGADVASTVPGV